MDNLLLQTFLPFFFSALFVILITVIAEKFGTKIGGIIGTIPTTIIIAYIFIAINKSAVFASNSASVVPAEMGINVLFLCILTIISFKSIIKALILSFIVWIFLTSLLYFSNIQNIYFSVTIFVISTIFTILILEKYKKIPSQGKKHVHYTPLKIVFRGITAGFIIMISVLLSNVGEVISGIFSVFPAILLSTMIITYREHGPDFSAAIAKSMIFGSPSIMIYATSIHFLYPHLGIIYGSIISYIISLFSSIIIFKLRDKII